MIAENIANIEEDKLNASIYAIKKDSMDEYKNALIGYLEQPSIEAIKQSKDNTVERNISYEEYQYLDRVITNIVYLESMIATLYISEPNDITLIVPSEE